MTMHKKPAPPPQPAKPDFSLLHAPASFFWMVTAVVAGIALTRLAPTEETLHLALAYGFVGLVGFIGQIIVGMKPKILSVFTWYQAFAGGADAESLARPIDMPVRIFQAVTFGLWLIGIPLFARGILFTSRLLVAAGAIALLSALVISTIHEITILRIITRTR